jgi:hypothetical protein
MVKEKLYPFLVSNSDNIDDAKIFLSSISVAIKQKYLNGMRNMPVGDLKMTEMLDVTGDSYKKYSELFDMLKEYSITDALSMVEGMPNEIDSSIREEMQTRKLDTLKVTLI